MLKMYHLTKYSEPGQPLKDPYTILLSRLQQSSLQFAGKYCHPDLRTCTRILRWFLGGTNKWRWPQRFCTVWQ